MELTVEATIALVGVVLGLPAVALSSWQIWKWLGTGTRQEPDTALGKSQRRPHTEPRNTN